MNINQKEDVENEKDTQNNSLLGTMKMALKTKPPSVKKLIKFIDQNQQKIEIEKKDIK